MLKCEKIRNYPKKIMKYPKKKNETSKINIKLSKKIKKLKGKNIQK